MGILSGLKNTHKKSEAAVAVQNLLENQAKHGFFDLDPAKVANRLVESVWARWPESFDGRFGQRPHRVSVAAAALAYGIVQSEDEDPNREALALCLGTVLSEIEQRGSLYPLNALDHRLLASAMTVFADLTRELAESPLGREIDEAMAIYGNKQPPAAKVAPASVVTPPQHPPQAPESIAADGPARIAVAEAQSSSIGALGWVFAAGLAGFVGAAVIMIDQLPTSDTVASKQHATQTVANPIPESAIEPVTPPVVPIHVFRTGDRQALVAEGADAVETVAGILAVSNGSGTPGKQLYVKGEPLPLASDHLHLLSITRHADQDIVLVGIQCGGSACGFLELAFVRLFERRPPLVERADDFIYYSDFTEVLKQGISFRDEMTEVALGLEGGSHRTAVIGPTRPLTLLEEPAMREALTLEQCGMVKEALEECVGFTTTCAEASPSEFPANCPDATMDLYRTTNYLARHTTGLNLPAFAQSCATASRIGLTPSDGFVDKEICSRTLPAEVSATESTGSPIAAGSDQSQVGAPTAN